MNSWATTTSSNDTSSSMLKARQSKGHPQDKLYLGVEPLNCPICQEYLKVVEDILKPPPYCLGCLLQLLYPTFCYTAQPPQKVSSGFVFILGGLIPTVKLLSKPHCKTELRQSKSLSMTLYPIFPAE